MTWSVPIDQRVTEAFDLVESLRRGRKDMRLLLRIAYVNLSDLMKDVNLSAEIERVVNCTSRKVGAGESFAAIDHYSRVKSEASGSLLRRRRLMEHARVASRWDDISGSSYSLLIRYSKETETIM